MAGVAACLAFVLQGCSRSLSTQPGVYLASVNDGSFERVGETAGAPVWTPRGDALIWAGEDGLFRRELSEPETSRLSDRAVVGRPAVSPDGSAIAVIDRDGEALVVLDARSGDQRFSIDIATTDAEHAPLALPVLGGPSWAPDGSRLAYTCWDGHGDEICVVRADGTGIRQLTHIQTRTYPSAPPAGALTTSVSNAGPPSWSPNGEDIALAVYPEQRGAPGGVFVIDLNAGTARRVSSLLPNSEIAWFANGEALLFSARDQGRSDAVRMPLDSGDPEKLSAALEREAREPALSGDQRLLAVSSGHNILVLGPEGNIAHALGDGLDQRVPAWSPGGDQLAFAAGENPLLNYP